MTAMPPPLHTVACAINDYHAANQAPPRPHLGASQIGHPCERFVWLSFRWAVIQKFEGRLLRLFRRGHLEEKTVHNDMRAVGCDIKTIDPKTKKQYAFADGHFAGSCDGIIAGGLPEARKTPHLLEIKTHSLKSFKDLEAKGVKASKPQHWVQMQVYMAKFELSDALYYAVCKDNDAIYTERVKHDHTASSIAQNTANRVIESDRLPPPLSTQPTWYECKWCPAHDLCHSSKLTKEVNCRTCAHSTAVPDGRWHCAYWKADIPTVEAQRAGCDNHVLHPDLVPGWQYEAADVGVIWLTPHGRIHNAPDGHTSREIVANWQACAKNVKAEVPANFEPRVTG